MTRIDDRYARYCAARARLWRSAIAWSRRMTNRPGGATLTEAAVISLMEGTPPTELEAAAIAFTDAQRDAGSGEWPPAAPAAGGGGGI